eukprot:6187089-Pleurochrysis_carterae.AAC.1
MLCCMPPFNARCRKGTRSVSAVMKPTNEPSAVEVRHSYVRRLEHSRPARCAQLRYPLRPRLRWMTIAPPVALRRPGRALQGPSHLDALTAISCAACPRQSTARRAHPARPPGPPPPVCPGTFVLLAHALAASSVGCSGVIPFRTRSTHTSTLAVAVFARNHALGLARARPPRACVPSVVSVATIPPAVTSRVA